MQEGDLFFTLIGPLGPETDFDEYWDYRVKTIREMDVETVLAGIRLVPTTYRRWKDDVTAVGIEYMEVHPEDEAKVTQALLNVGLDPDVEAEDSCNSWVACPTVAWKMG